MIKPDWSGKTIVCIASGPSLTKEDCDLVRESGHFTVVVNTSFRHAPWGDVLFAFDAKWWKEYYLEVSKVFEGKKYTFSNSIYPDVESLNQVEWFNNFGNSGACAIGLAIAANADKIILLGYDCQIKDKTHWHGDHPDGWSNCSTIKRWPTHFKCMSDDARRDGIQVINASRETALTCFDRMDLEFIL